MTAVPFTYFTAEQECFLWRDRNESDIFIAMGVARETTSADIARGWIAELSSGELPFIPRCFGYVAFDPEHKLMDEWSGFHCRRFLLPQQLTRVSAIGEAITLHFRETDDNFLSTAAHGTESIGSLNGFGPAKWNSAVGEVLRNIERGVLDKCVLAERLTLSTVDLSRLPDVLRMLSEQNPLCSLFALSNGLGDVFLGASPERLFLLNGDSLRVESLAGTRARGQHSAQDNVLASELESSKKERREQSLVTEFLSGALNSLSMNVHVVNAPTVRQLPNVQHLLTELAGTLRPQITLDEILDTLHPTPAVCGTPTHAAQRMIRELEPHRRGLYTGAIGWIEAERAEFAVAIRSALVTPTATHFYGGAGIVAGSIAEAEYAECLLKMETVKRAFA